MTITPRRAQLRAIDIACDRLALAEEIAADRTANAFTRQGRPFTRCEMRALLFANEFWGMALREPVVMDELRRAAA